MPRAVKSFVIVTSVLLAGLLAGLQWGTGMAQYTALSLPGPVWLLRHQAEDSLFRLVMPGYMWAVLILLVLATVTTRGRARLLFAAAAVLSLAQMIITVAHEVPINRMVQHWSPDALPADWDAVRHRWMGGHWARTGLSVVAFLFAILGLERRGAQE